ncbi:MAG TPA: sugar transferase [Bryobacteraceae bacterium]|nr:sugar transferase [Bryobacteraceae bacterium]
MRDSRVLYKLSESIERCGALIAVVLLSPLFAFVGVTIFVLSGRGPMVAHRRLGRFGVPFWMLKFRSMWNEPTAAGFIEYLPDRKVPEVKAGVDPRVTSRFAAFCRKYSIDELPQLWHVVRGEMSLVGPRPVTPVEWEKYYGAASSEVLNLKPGLSGLWQTRGRNRLTYRQRRRLDIFLARHYCLLLYMRILGQTVPRVIAGRDAW